MKKMLLVALLGLGLTLTSGRPASAWCKFNFGVGLNINYEGGGNSVLWGLFKGAPCPHDQHGMMCADGMPGPIIHDQGPIMEPGHPPVPPPGQEPLMAPTPAPAPAAAPKPMPALQMPRANEHQPVGYFEKQPQKEEEGDYYAPSYWYGR